MTQGSVVSVVLFAVAINGIVEIIHGDILISLYVDDLAIYYASINIASTKRKLPLYMHEIVLVGLRNTGFNFLEANLRKFTFIYRKRNSKLNLSVFYTINR